MLGIKIRYVVASFQWLFGGVAIFGVILAVWILL